MTKALLSKILLVCALVIAVALNSLIIGTAQIRTGKSSDFPEFYTAGKLTVEGRANQIYDVEAFADKQHELFTGMNERVVALYLPPLSLPFLAPLGLVASRIAEPIWQVLLLLSLLGSVFLLKMTFSLTKSESLWLLTLVLVSGPWWECLRLGQIAGFLLLLLCAGILALKKEKDELAGIAFGVMLIKPQLIIPLSLYLLGARKFKCLGAMTVVGAILLVVSFAIIGQTGFETYLSTFISKLNSIGSTAGMNAIDCPTFRGQLLRIFGEGATSLSTIALSLVCLGSLLLGNQLKNSHSWLEAGLVTALPLGIVFSLHCHNYDTLLLLPFLCASQGLIAKDAKARMISPILFIGATLFLLPIYMPIYYGFVLPGGIVNPLFFGLLIPIATVVYLQCIRMRKSNSNAAVETKP